MTETLQVHGGCHCGAIAYEATVDPARVTICHCTDCQRLTGTAYRVTVAAPAAGFRLLRGEPRTYRKTGSSGNPRAQVFCADCGSHLYAHAAVARPESYGLRVGCLAERAQLAPRRRIWCRSALGWSENLAGLEKNDRE